MVNKSFFEHQKNNVQSGHLFLGCSKIKNFWVFNFEHEDYPKIMFLGLIVMSMVVLFSFVDFVDDVNNGFTAYVIQEQNMAQDIPVLVNASGSEVGEIYTIQAWSIFYVAIIITIVLVAILFVILKRTVQKNIEEEDKSGGFLE